MVNDRPSQKALAFRLKMAQISPPTAEDWMVELSYRGFDSEDHKKRVRIGSMRAHGQPIEITEEEAVKRALESLRRYVVNTRRAGWDEIPRVYHARAIPRHRTIVQNINTHVEDLLVRFKSMKHG